MDFIREAAAYRGCCEGGGAGGRVGARPRVSFIAEIIAEGRENRKNLKGFRIWFSS